MDGHRYESDSGRLAVAARAVSLAATLGLVVASVGPAEWTPRLLYSYHLEHFAAFYVVTLLASAARYRTRLRRLAFDIVLLATLLELGRAITPSHRMTTVEDWMSDIGGMLAALAPLVVARFRSLFAPRTAAGPAAPEI